MSQTPSDNEHSFNLTKENRQRNASEDVEKLSPFTWQEHAYERLKVLYGVAKILTTVDDFERIFPKVLSICAESFPFLTAIVLDNRSEKLKKFVWNSDNASLEQVHSAIRHAKESFIYLTNASASKSHDLRMSFIHSEQLEGIHTEEDPDLAQQKNYCVIPLVVDHLPAFGILQLEGARRLNEKDLEFIGALADHIAVFIDRHYKTQIEKELREKEVEESLIKLSRSETHVSDLENQRELRENFVSLLSHDLRTPLSGIKMNAQLIERNTEDKEAIKNYAQRIDNSVNRADQMISDLLDANLIRSGEKLPLKIESVELLSLVKATLHELSIVHGDRFILNADKVIMGHWDPKGIRRILENLCNNAVKYGSVEGKITITLKMKGGNVFLEVHNTGSIIPSEDQKYLFQQFHQGRKNVTKGWGIGLTLVRGVAEAHGGMVDVESEMETGTIFTVALPLDSRPFISH